MLVKWIHFFKWTNVRRFGLRVLVRDDDIDSESYLFLRSSSGRGRSSWLLLIAIIILIIKAIWLAVIGIIISFFLFFSLCGLFSISLLLHHKWFNHESIVSSLPSGVASSLNLWNNNWRNRNWRLVVRARFGGILVMEVIWVGVKMDKMLIVWFIIADWIILTDWRNITGCVVVLLWGPHSTGRFDWSRALVWFHRVHWELAQVLRSQVKTRCLCFTHVEWDIVEVNWLVLLEGTFIWLMRHNLSFFDLLFQWLSHLLNLLFDIHLVQLNLSQSLVTAWCSDAIILVDLLFSINFKLVLNGSESH